MKLRRKEDKRRLLGRRQRYVVTRAKQAAGRGRVGREAGGARTADRNGGESGKERGGDEGRDW